MAASAGTVQRARRGARSGAHSSRVDRRRAGRPPTAVRGGARRGVRRGAPGGGVLRELRARVHPAAPRGGAAAPAGARAHRTAPRGPAPHGAEPPVPSRLRRQFSIKKTLPALVPGLSYSDLKVRDGEVATVELQRLMFRGAEMPAGERAALREALLRYCERDTWAMVKLLEKLRSLVGDQLELF